MTVAYKARVWEVGTITGAGPYNLPNAANSGAWRTVAGSGLSSGQNAIFCLQDTVTNAWELSLFTYTSGSPGTLTRVQFLESSTGSAITFAGNSTNITLEIPSPVTASAGTASSGLVPALNTSGVLDSSFGGSGSRGLFSLGTMPSMASFTQLGVGGNVSAVENAGKAFTIIDVQPVYTSSPYLNGFSKTVPSSTPYRVAIYCLFNSLDSAYWGPAFGWSNGTEYHVASMTGSQTFSINNFASLTNRVSTSDNIAKRPMANAGIWFGLHDDGTNVYFEVSSDGANYIPIYITTKSAGYLGSTGYSNTFFGQFDVNGTYSSDTQYPLSTSFLAYDENGLTRVVG
jgi:hypothetical protein